MDQRSTREPTPPVIIDPALLSSDAACVDLQKLGGKARSLVELGRLQPARVPPWFAVSADVFVEALDASGVAHEISQVLARLETLGPQREAVDSCAAELALLLEPMEIPQAAQTAIIEAYQKLGGGDVAVRSSALDEDGQERSFAGCLDTSLYVAGAQELMTAVLGCWRSAFSARSLAYRAATGALDATISVAVVVQRMVTGSVSGVLFSADPSTGKRQAILTSAWGLGEGVVSGRAHCDTFVVDRDSRAVVERDVVDKTLAVVRDDLAGSGTREIAIETAMRDQATLGDDQLCRLAELGWTIESAYGNPVDVEWTWNEDGPWILQARPITTIGKLAAEPPSSSKLPAAAGGARRLWDNSNIIESYHGVTTPLTYSFARKAYGIVYRLAFGLLGTPQDELARYQPVFEQLIGLLRGRIYYNLESWYKLIQLLPAYKFNAEFMEQMMGVSESAGFERGNQTPTSASQRYLIELPKLVASLSKLSYKFARSEKLVSEFFDNFGDAYADFEEVDLEAASYDEIVSVYLEAEERLLQRWQAPIINDILAMIFFGALRKVLTSWGFADSSLHNALLCGEGGLESTEPTRNLLTLMVDLRQDRALCELLRTQDADTIRATVEGEAAFGWLKVRIAAHVERFGDRCVDELKLEEPTLGDDPTFLYAALKGYLSAPPVTVQEMETREAAIRADAEARVAAALRNPVKRRLFQWILSRARLHVKNRENLRFSRTRAFGLVRRLSLAMGRRLTEAKLLDHRDDVFYLEIGELIDFSRGTATTTDLRGLVEVRKREFAGHRAASDPPERFWTEGPTYLSEVLTSSTILAPCAEGPAIAGTVFSGIAASPGRVRGPARLVTDPRSTSLSGEILVANRTDPGWVPLFPSALAVVVERGSVLSHSAIVAREFGIPCVVGARDAIERLRDGQQIEVDGAAGTVTVLQD